MILDVESTSLSEKRGLPIQVAWNNNDKIYHCYLNIIPVLSNDFEWSSDSQLCHNISIGFIEKFGSNPYMFCHLLNDFYEAANKEFVADSSLDDCWLNNLFSACGIKKKFVVKKYDSIVNNSKSIKDFALTNNHLAHHDVFNVLNVNNL